MPSIIKLQMSRQQAIHVVMGLLHRAAAAGWTGKKTNMEKALPPALELTISCTACLQLLL
jgi:hypothetical protein